MILARYIRNRFFTYFVVSNTALVLLYTLIEFFEKLTRIHHTTFATIICYVAQHFIVTFFDLFPLSATVACALLAREFSREAVYDNIAVIGISSRTALNALAVAGMVVSAASFVGKEFIAHHYDKQTQIVRAQQFKQQYERIEKNIWIRVHREHIIHCDAINIDTCTASGILVMQLSDQFFLDAQWRAATGTIDFTHETITLIDGFHYDAASKKDSRFSSYTYHIPELFALLKERYSPMSWYDVLMHTSDPGKKRNWAPLYATALTHMQPCMYIMLCSGLFIFFLSRRLYAWLITLAIYPLFVMIISFIDFLVRHNSPIFLSGLPYALGTACIIFVWYALN